MTFDINGPKVAALVYIVMIVQALASLLTIRGSIWKDIYNYFLWQGIYIFYASMFCYVFFHHLAEHAGMHHQQVEIHYPCFIESPQVVILFTF